jgi:RsiW-degrading membrane proteinase PrsW (M82 family)
MRTESRIKIFRTETVEEKNLSVDTSFVLFFLAVEFGRTFFSLSVDNIFMFFALLTVAVLPYFLLSDEKPNFSKWLLGRSLIAGFAILLGAMFKQSLGVVLPETFRFLPMTLLIVTAMLCCYIQFYSFFRLRLAK